MMKQLFGTVVLALGLNMVALADESRGDPAPDFPRQWIGEYATPGARLPMTLTITALRTVQMPGQTTPHSRLDVWVIDADGTMTIGTEVYPLKQVTLTRTTLRGNAAPYEIYFTFTHEFAVSLFGQMRQTDTGVWEAKGYQQGGWRNWVLRAH